MTAYQSAEQTLNAFFDTLPWPVLIVDERGLITFVNQASQASADKAHAVPGKPLTAINSTVQLLRSNSQCPPALLEKGLSNIATNVQRVLNISRKLNDFSRAGEDARAALNLRATVTDAVSLVLHDALMRDVSVDCQLDATTLVVGDSSQLQQVFCNVLTNAAQAMQGRGNLFIADTRPDAACVEV